MTSSSDAIRVYDTLCGRYANGIPQPHQRSKCVPHLGPFLYLYVLLHGKSRVMVWPRYKLPHEERDDQYPPQQMRNLLKHNERRYVNLLDWYTQNKNLMIHTRYVSRSSEVNPAYVDQEVHAACSIQGGQSKASAAGCSPSLHDGVFVSVHIGGPTVCCVLKTTYSQTAHS